MKSGEWICKLPGSQRSIKQHPGALLGHWHITSDVDNGLMNRVCEYPSWKPALEEKSMNRKFSSTRVHPIRIPSATHSILEDDDVRISTWIEACLIHAKDSYLPRGGTRCSCSGSRLFQNEVLFANDDDWLAFFCCFWVSDMLTPSQYYYWGSTFIKLCMSLHKLYS